ncbi:tRNA dimethylallyltransferase [Sphingomonas jinjuensis]|uniref:tRNA dimethylallyltransferase n=1 Tax=Sphingomonas jinjuensis TaxID=535907 RepID=A0A840F674_9SPHN|nr:tRNA (adenosine(37)-N6)-dimethylallyltransferase MiaA [Sphingomonas jinjuensis]MBB4153410.1 tRNA dimethylallyltransferase [Sphingomonas jinjuensis]
MSRPKLALIAGPTASGKSSAAIALAEATGGTVINADASQVYADLRVLTARPSEAEEERVPHRLFGHIDAADTGYSAARWSDEAKAAVAEAIMAGRLPILVGGTGLYLRTLLHGIAPVPPIVPDIRAEVRAMSVGEAHRALCAEDSITAARLSPNDSARVARALEVVRSTGVPIHHWQKQREGGIANDVDLAAAILLPDRELLYERINARADAMIADGAIDEVAGLMLRRDVGEDAPARRAIGVSALIDHLTGRMSLSEALESLALDTRRYAKRQYTWFRHQPPENWSRCETADDALQQIVTLLRQ